MKPARKMHIQDDENGLHPNMGRVRYDELDRVNWSTLKEMTRSPAHYAHRLTVEREDTDAMQFGRCVHMAVLEPDKFASEVEAWEGGARRGKEWEAFKTEHAGKEILTQSDFFKCLAIQGAVRGTDAAKKYLEGGPAELTVLWTHKIEAVGGLPGYSIDCKGRLDFLAQTAIPDLKTTKDASPEGFGRQMWSLDSLGAAAFYVDGYAAVTGEVRPFVYLAVEKEPPHVVQVYRVTDAQIARGREMYRGALDRLHVCRRDGVFPGYADGELELELPRWAMPADDEEDLSETGLVFPKE